ATRTGAAVARTAARLRRVGPEGRPAGALFWSGGATPLEPPAGPRPRSPVTGPWPCWSGGATPGTPPLARGSCDSVAGALAVPAGGATPRNPPLARGSCDSVAGALARPAAGATRSPARGCAGPGRLLLVMPGAASPPAGARPEPRA